MRRRRPIKMQHRLALVIMLFSLIPMSVLGFVTLSRADRDARDAALSGYRSAVEADARVADELLARSVQKTRFVLSNREIAMFLFSRTPQDLVNKLSFVEYVQNMMSALGADDDDVLLRLYSFGIHTDMGNYLFSEETFRGDLAQDEALLQRVLSGPADAPRFVVRQIDRRAMRRGSLLSLCMYQRLEYAGRTAGVISFDVPLSALLEPTQQALPEGAHLAFQSNARDEGFFSDLLQPGCNECQAMLAQFIETGTLAGYSVVHGDVKAANAALYLLLPNGAVYGGLWQNLFLYGALLALVLVLVLASTEVASYLLQRRTIRAMDDMSRDIDRIIGGEAFPDAPDSGDIGRIRERAYALMRKTQEALEKIREVSEENHRLELELLQQRFNPHFLYNTLGSISSLSKDRGVRETIEAMIAYYRIVLNQGRTVIAIDEELQLIAEYLRIQRFAYDLDFDIVYDLEPGVGAHGIVKHLLQPVVENALFHGVRTAHRRGELTLAAFHDGEDIVFSIRDNGMGMLEEKVASLLHEPTRMRRGGYGMYNVQRRIQVHYGAQYGILVKSAPGEGTEIIMRIRAEAAPKEP